jgi:nicotinate-nucleotide--dimethylbenzimidazole phosphoribosyltransferase
MPTESSPLWQPPAISLLDFALAATMRAQIDGKAKPLESLGCIENLAVQIGYPANPQGGNAVLPAFDRDTAFIGSTEAIARRRTAAPVSANRSRRQ